MDEHPPSPAPDVPNDAERRADLVLRLLTSQMGGQRGAMQLLPGQLPADLPLTLPLPADARIVGSMTRAQTPEPPLVTILVDAPQSAERVATFYTVRLEAIGWRLQLFPHRPGGFITTQPGGYSHLRFTDGAGEHALIVAIQPGATAGETTLQMTLQKEKPLVWRRRGMSHEQMRAAAGLIPTLAPPPGAAQQGGGGGGGMGRWHSNARVETELAVAGVIAHYDRQLERGGWQRRDGGSSGPAGWSFWSFTDTAGGPWRGVMLALNTPDHPQRYLLLVEIEAEGQSAQPGSGSGYVTFGSLSG